MPLDVVGPVYMVYFFSKPKTNCKNPKKKKLETNMMCLCDAISYFVSIFISISIHTIGKCIFVWWMCVYDMLRCMIHMAVGCSHQRAWEYFIESIQRPSAFLATHCEPKTTLPVKNHTEINCDKNISAYMGYNADTR